MYVLFQWNQLKTLNSQRMLNHKKVFSHVMRKPVFAISEQQMRRSACASAQSDQHLYYSLLRLYNTYTCEIQNFKTLAGLCSWAGRFKSYLVGNPEDRFSRRSAYVHQSYSIKWLTRFVKCYNFLYGQKTAHNLSTCSLLQKQILLN